MSQRQQTSPGSSQAEADGEPASPLSLRERYEFRRAGIDGQQLVVRNNSSIMLYSYGVDPHVLKPVIVVREELETLQQAFDEGWNISMQYPLPDYIDDQGKHHAMIGVLLTRPVIKEKDETN